MLSKETVPVGSLTTRRAISLPVRVSVPTSNSISSEWTSTEKYVLSNSWLLFQRECPLQSQQGQIQGWFNWFGRTPLFTFVQQKHTVTLKFHSTKNILLLQRLSLALSCSDVGLDITGILLPRQLSASLSVQWLVMKWAWSNPTISAHYACQAVQIPPSLNPGSIPAQPPYVSLVLFWLCRDSSRREFKQGA